MDGKKLTGLVFWPSTGAQVDAQVLLCNADGEMFAAFKLEKPMRGEDLARLVPPGCGVETTGCEVINSTGSLKVQDQMRFDTAVVMERRQQTFEERMERIERAQRAREKQFMELANARQRIAEENERLREQLEQSEQQTGEPEVTTTEPKSDATTEQAESEVANAEK